MKTNLIPEAALRQHIAIIGKTGAGKTTAAKGLVEPLLERGSRVAVVDPTGAWWGLRSSSDGKGPGFPVLVLGGEHCDMPLPPGSGEAVAKLVAENGINLVADTSSMTVGERTRWFTAFASAIYRLNRAPLHLVLDESHNFAPQGRVPDPDAARMLHATNSLASGGRSRGVRLMLLTQRPQKLHKDTLTSADTLIAMRVLAPQDRDAVKSWIDGCGDPKQGMEVLGSLASLSRGEGWAWYPEGNFLRRLTFPAIRTFDSSAAPVDGHHAAPTGAAPIDLEAIRYALATAAEEFEANDVRHLRDEIIRLRKEIDAKPAGASQADMQDAYKQGRTAGYRDAARHLYSQIHGFRARAVEHIQKSFDDLGLAALEPYFPGEALLPAEEAIVIVDAPSAQRPKLSELRGIAAGVLLPKAQRLILTALAQHPQGRTKSQIAILTGYAQNGGGFNNSIGSLRSAGLIDGRENIRITDEGRKALGHFDPLPTGKALLDHWCQQVGKAERLILQAAANAYPRGLSKAELGERAGYEPSGGGFNNAIGRLRTLELIVGRGEIRASDNLFG